MQAPLPDSLIETDADLADCAREPIHLSGAIQPHGCLLVCDLDGWTVTHASANAAAFLELAGDAPLVGRSAEDIIARQLLHDLRNTLQGSMISGSAERLVNVTVAEGLPAMDAAIHAAGRSAVLEFNLHAGADTTTTDPIVLVKSMVGRLKRAPTLARFLQLAAAQLRAVTGYDRVMIYKFLPDDSGQVVAEAVRSGLTPFLDLRYPASDIPAQARDLYKRQWLRMIVDVTYTPVPILDHADAEPLDLSLSSLRSVSPIHLEYLRNMGSAATLTVSLMAGDRLWGLIACHHEAPRRISAATCAAAELFGQIFSLQIEAKEHAEEQAHAARSHDAHDRLIAGMPLDETPFDNLARFDRPLRELIPCDGIGVWSEGRFTGIGDVPPTSALPGMIELLDHADPHEVFSTSLLAREMPLATTFADRVSGMVALPFSRATRHYLLFFRREVIQTVTWGGNPQKPVEKSPDGIRIGPRKSFEAWREVVRGQSVPWRPAEIQIAESLRVSLLDVILRRSDLLNKERRAAQEGQSLLIAELNHRVKNVLALIRSLVRQSRQGADSLDTFTTDLEHRIRALAFAHDQLTHVGWRGAPLRQLLVAEVDAWASQAGGRVEFDGPVVTLGSRAYQALALVFHEMMTNAAKYGALSGPAGVLQVRWVVDVMGDLQITWTESGGPPVQPPKRRGFGSVIVDQTVPFELQGESRVDFRPEGVRGFFRVPAASLVPNEPESAADMEGAGPDLALPPAVAIQGKRLLLVEDSMMIALDAQAMLSDAGLNVEIAGNVADAGRALTVNAFDLAVLDVNLSGETSFPVADALRGRGVPFVFATGYGESIAVPERYADVPVVAKPYDEKSLRFALARTASR